MKNFVKLTCSVAVAIFAAAQANAVVYFSDDFSYADGAITNVSGGVWNGFSGNSPVNVSNGQAIVSQNLTQDVAAQLAGSPHSTDVLYLKYDFMFDALPGPTNATSYFTMFKDSGTSLFIGRQMAGTVAGDAAGDFRLGFNTGTGSTPTPGMVSSALTTGIWYTAVFKLDQTAVSAPVMTLWINPTLESDPNVSAAGTLANLAVSTIALRQATTEGRVNIDNMVIGDSFAAVIPEPSTVVLVGAGLVGLLALRRRRS